MNNFVEKKLYMSGPTKLINQPPEQQTKQTNDEFVVVAVTKGLKQ